ncbi:Similar to Nuclear speckle splicing regulatory protein 1 homolog; acc. no. O14009 [Pyronema omphalodes CBS 100304]|uniref:Similar to Nuclear speckle splicing regulatory protein 1 homolog acc. no. O14009 n=1 Tax=Pyronema omphalodes (strain CBS 100304) TaxID=1076935 RepID=U4KXW1_PYROM|nr:Similar to Nuclear speckle splicing regulatory protein 1 homolog; acc. no. O14009 [Pyronema omphalodes CBS 100304]
MSGIKIGLGGIKPKKPLGPPKSKKPLNAFAAADDEEDNVEEEIGGVFGGGAKDKKKKGGRDVSVVNAQLATFNEMSKKAEKAAAEIDPSVYDYDAVWDDMKSVDRKKKKAEELDAVERKPKYMQNLLESAEIRKRDQLRAKEKMLQKEREAEGEEFADKESFVTSAYKKQQEEMKKLEEEERIREENLKKKSQGMSSFHRNMLNKMESKHDELVAAAGSGDKDNEKDKDDEEETLDAEKAAAEKARLLREKGAAIDVNEEGNVVDKTELLSGGLNITASKKRVVDSRSGPDDVRRPQQAYQGRGKSQQEMRARQTRMMEEQLAQAQKRALEEEEKAKEELERQSKSRKTDTDVKSAKERYLARKAAAAAEAKK